jgi:endonuclease YncB( thermonuclease family)
MLAGSASAIRTCIPSPRSGRAAWPALWQTRAATAAGRDVGVVDDVVDGDPFELLVAPSQPAAISQHSSTAATRVKFVTLKSIRSPCH